MKSRFSFKFKCFSSALLIGGLGLSLSSPVHAQVVSLYDNNVMVDLSALDGQSSAAAPTPFATPQYTGANLPPLTAPKSQFLGVPNTLQAPSRRAIQPQNTGKIVLRNPAASSNNTAPTSSIAQTAAASKPTNVPAPVMAGDTASASLIKFKDEAPAEKKMQQAQPAPKKMAKAAPKPVAPKPKAAPAPKPAAKMTKPEPVVAKAPTPPAPIAKAPAAQPPKPKAAPVKPVEVAMAPKAPATPAVPQAPAPKAEPEAKQVTDVANAPRAITPPPPPPVSANAPETPAAPVVKAEETMAKPQEPVKAKAVAALPPAEQSDIRIRFDEAQSRLPDTALDNLRSLADQMRDNEDQRVQLLSYAGGEDLSASKARRLSLSRALAVRSYLIGQGVRSTRIDVRALGNKTTEQPFDRVDIKITDR